MNFLLECLMFLLILILSVPLHELGHLLAFKLIAGSTTKFEVRWLTFSRGFIEGYIKPADGTDLYHIADFWGRYPKVPVFLSLLLGGWTVAFIYWGLSSVVMHYSGSFTVWGLALRVVGSIHFIYGVIESFGVRKLRSIS